MDAVEAGAEVRRRKLRAARLSRAVTAHRSWSRVVARASARKCSYNIPKAPCRRWIESPTILKVLAAISPTPPSARPGRLE
eukprot:2899090-Prymnesium_polylepis.1